MNDNTSEEFVVTNKKLEQFLYSLGFKPHHQTKTADFMTCWHFTKSPKLEKAVKFYGEFVGSHESV